MRSVRQVGSACSLAILCVASGGCGAAGDSGGETATLVEQAAALNCDKAEAKDVLIAQLMRDSWGDSSDPENYPPYPLTRLSVDPSGNVTGPGLPPAVKGDLDLINSVPEAHDSVVRALAKVSGSGEYSIGGIGPDTDACPDVPAWTPNGEIRVSTVANELFITGGDKVWKETQKAFAQECPLIKTNGNHYIIDPPGDGSTSLPPSETVSAWGVRANAYGICPTGSWSGVWCKLSYATGINWTGRSCQAYCGYLRCLLY